MVEKTSCVYRADDKMDGHFSNVVPLLFEKVSSKQIMDNKIMRCSEASHKMDETFQSIVKHSKKFCSNLGIFPKTKNLVQKIYKKMITGIFPLITSSLYHTL